MPHATFRVLNLSRLHCKEIVRNHKYCFILRPEHQKCGTISFRHYEVQRDSVGLRQPYIGISYGDKNWSHFSFIGINKSWKVILYLLHFSFYTASQVTRSSVFFTSTMLLLPAFLFVDFFINLFLIHKYLFWFSW